MRIVIVGGCGHVGLPLGIAFARSGIDVDLLDIALERVEKVNSGKMPFIEEAAAEHLCAVIGKTLRATTDANIVKSADVCIAVVGTPVDEHLNPTLKHLHKSLDSLVKNMREDSLLILRSTIYPGVTRLVYERIMALGLRIHLAFCPERIAEGKAMRELFELPQIVAGFDEEARRRAKALFLCLTPEVVELSPLEAELAKLFTNSWRYLNFAISNQFYMLAESYGVSFDRIHHAVTHNYPRMKSFARAGFAAGPCLLKDTLQLAAFSGNNFFLGHAAMLVNEGLPNFIVDKLRKRCSDLRQKSIAILGMAFKGDSDDSRESLSYKLRNLLLVEAGSVLCCDPYVSDDSFFPLAEALKADIIILGAPHSVYRGLPIPAEKLVVDVWGFWDHEDSAKPAALAASSPVVHFTKA